MRLLVDMDGVIANFEKRVWFELENYYVDLGKEFPKPETPSEFYIESEYKDDRFRDAVRFIQSQRNFFYLLEPIEGAIEALRDLEKDYEVFICTAPLFENPTCCDDKIAWIDKHLGGDWIRRTIITKDKTVIDGDFLIDDKPIITGIVEEPLWQRIVFDQPYNKNIVGRRLNWNNYKQVIDKIW